MKEIQVQIDGITLEDGTRISFHQSDPDFDEQVKLAILEGLRRKELQGDIQTRTLKAAHWGAVTSAILMGVLTGLALLATAQGVKNQTHPPK